MYVLSLLNSVFDNIGRFCLSNPDVSFTIIGSSSFFKEAMIITWMQLPFFYFNQKVRQRSRALHVHFHRLYKLKHFLDVAPVTSSDYIYPTFHSKSLWVFLQPRCLAKFCNFTIFLSCSLFFSKFERWETQHYQKSEFWTEDILLSWDERDAKGYNGGSLEAFFIAKVALAAIDIGTVGDKKQCGITSVRNYLKYAILCII